MFGSSSLYLTEMGSSISQGTYDVLEEDQARSPDSKLKTLPREFDPRSPSDGIFRTPIQIAAMPVQLLDPRSPSMGIDRTPIYPMRPNGDNEVCNKDVENVDIIASLTTAIGFKRGLSDDAQEIPLLDLSATEPMLEEIVPQGAGFRPQVLTGPVIHTDCEEEEVETDKIRCESQKEKPLLQPNPLRSPLTARNNNAGSLRSIVQLKEARKAENFRCALESSDDLRNRKVSTVNKENM